MHSSAPTHPIIQDSEHKERLARRRRWVEDAFVHTYGEAQEGILYGQAERRETGFLVRVSVSMPGSAGPEEFQRRIEALARRLIASGFNHATYIQTGGLPLLELWLLHEPVRVVTVAGPHFTAEMGPDETVENAVKRIARNGAWRHMEDGRSVYVSPHHITGIEIDRAFATSDLAT